MLNANCCCYHSAVSSFGEHLRRQREMRGVSLEEIVATTKISRRLLQALEEEQFDLLPGGIFNKSYVKAYAKCVGIDPDEAVIEYLEAAQETPPDTKVIAHQHESLHSDRRSQRGGFPLVPVLVLLLVAAGGVGGWKVYRDRQQREQPLPQTSPTETSVAPSDVAPVAPASAAEGSNSAAENKNENQSPAPGPATLKATGQSGGLASAAAPSRPAESAAGAGDAARLPFEITVRPRDRAWVSIKADGNYVVRGVIEPPEVKTIHATGNVVFYTGNAGAVAVAFNGKDIPLTGGLNDPQTLIFDARGLRPKDSAQ